MHNSLTIIPRAWWRMNMESSARSVTNTPECTTHHLWFPKQDKEWTWNNQHNDIHQYARMHNSPPIIPRVGWKMNIESSVPSQLPACQNAQLTHYGYQSRLKNGVDMEALAWSWSPRCQHPQLTRYDCQGRINNGHAIISMNTVTNMPECTTHTLWLPEQSKE